MSPTREQIESSFGSPRSEQILDALERILASDDFVASDRNRRFLSYVVGEALAGRAERLKGYNIAVQVFGRAETFDAQADPLVRVEARRLRQALERYYLMAGARDPVRISIPRGGYAPVFDNIASALQTALPTQARPVETRPSLRSRRLDRSLAAAFAAVTATILGVIVVVMDQEEVAVPQPAVQSRAAPMGPSVLVQSFAKVEGGTDEDTFRAGLTAELTHSLARFKTVRVIPEHSEAVSGSSAGQAQSRARAVADYVLKGSVRSAENAVRIVVQIEEQGSGALLWTRTFDRNANRDSRLLVQSQIASEVAMTLGDPYDVLFSNELNKAQAAGAAVHEPYACALRFYAYWLNPTSAEHRFLRDCHERSGKLEPFNAGIWTNLAWLYLDEHRFEYNRLDASDPPFERASEAARRAVSLQPDSARAHLAAAVVQWFRKDFRSFDRHAEIALSLNPNDVTVNAELGLRYGLRGDWEKSRPLTDRAISRDPTRWQTYRVSYAQHAVEIGDFERALEEIRLTKVTDHPAIKVLRAAAYGNLNRVEEAQADWEAAVQAMPQLGARPQAWIDDRSPSPALRRRILEGLEKAGLLEAE